MPRTGLEGAQRGQVTLEGLDTGRWRQSGNSPGRHNVNLSLKSAHGPNEWGGLTPTYAAHTGISRRVLGEQDTTQNLSIFTRVAGTNLKTSGPLGR